MSKRISIVLVGIGGYGHSYVRALMSNQIPEEYTVVGVVDPYPEKCDSIDEIREKGIPVFYSIEDFYASSEADLAVISSPVHYHCSQICYALQKGSNVLCEKPICPTVQEASEIIRERDRTGKFVAIGYQWSYTDAIQRLKRDILSGILGKPKRMKSIVLTPRAESYYQRANWAGKKRDAYGNWILDSVVSNATAHYMHNMFYILGNKIEESVSLKGVTAELYRANHIENYDTAAARIFTEDGVELLYYASHATKDAVNPMFCYEFEKGRVIFELDWYGASYEENQNIRKGNMWAAFNDGSYKIYGNPYNDEMNKLSTSIRAVLGETTIPCTPEASMMHTLCVNGMQDSMPEIIEFPEEFVKVQVDGAAEKRDVYVEGLEELLAQCYEKAILPSEANISWAKKGKYIDLENYTYFNQI